MSSPGPESQEWVAYYDACIGMPEVVEAVETYLAKCGTTKRLPAREVYESGAARSGSYDQVVRALRAIVALGHLNTAGELHFAPAGGLLQDQAQARLTVLQALRWASKRSDRQGDCELLLAAPMEAPESTVQHIGRFFGLRTTIRSMIAEATASVLLAAPYWDEHIAEDLISLVKGRVQAGVSIGILTRAPTPGSANARALGLLRSGVPASGASGIRILERPSSSDPFGTATFHFKVACVDMKRAYLGSANFNTAGLNSRWELGVSLTGARAATIESLVRTLWESATLY